MCHLNISAFESEKICYTNANEQINIFFKYVPQILTLSIWARSGLPFTAFESIVPDKRSRASSVVIDITITAGDKDITDTT